MIYNVDDELSSLFNNISIDQDLESLTHDLQIILLCQHLSEETGIIHMIPFNECHLKHGTYKSSSIMYKDIVSILTTSLNKTVDLLEIMPYIDDYISYFIP